MAQLEVYGHGGDLHTASEMFRIQPDQLLDFSANINPLGPPSAVIESLQREFASMRHYPDPAHRSFRFALANHLRVDPEWLLIGNGAAECMALAIQSLAPAQVGVIYPCFSEYAQLAEQFGASVMGCFGREPDFKPDRDDLYQLIQEVDLLFVGHPNNPTGITYSLEELVEIAHWTKESGTYLVIDEAFLDFLLPEKQVTLLTRLDQFPHVILIRSMTKFYAIPGLRLGYAAANPDVIDGMKRKQVTWSVNQFALIAGEACLEQEEYEHQTRELIIRERNFLRDAIENQFGWRVWPGEANFLLVQLPDEITANQLQIAMGKRGIMVRSCAMYPGLGPHHFRIAVKSRAENTRLLAALQQEYLQGGE